jgi:sarcosine oxidase subunit delta
MKIMHCPVNGPRNVSEFFCGGEVRDMPDPVSAPDRDWAAYTFIENNTKGVVREWWLHVPSSYWFIAERNTETDEILRTYPATELYATRKDFGPAGS